MKTLLATALLLGISSVTAAHAEWEVVDTGTTVNAPPATNATAMAKAKCASGLLRQKAIEHGSHHQPTTAEIACKQAAGGRSHLGAGADRTIGELYEEVMRRAAPSAGGVAAVARFAAGRAAPRTR